MCFCLCRLRLGFGSLVCSRFSQLPWWKHQWNMTFGSYRRADLGRSGPVPEWASWRSPGNQALHGHCERCLVLSCIAFSNIAKLSFHWLSHSPPINEVSELCILRNLSMSPQFMEDVLISNLVLHLSYPYPGHLPLCDTNCSPLVS